MPQEMGGKWLVTWCLTMDDGRCGSKIVWSWGCNNESGIVED